MDVDKKGKQIVINRTPKKGGCQLSSGGVLMSNSKGG